VVVHGGCRGGHTLAHARRLLLQALDTIAPAAAGAGVILALKPLHPAAVRSSLVRTPGEALEIIETAGHASLRLALDLWHVAEDADLPGLLPAVAPATAVVQVADRAGPPTAELDRLPTGRGTLPLAGIAALLVEHGDFEFDPVGESVEECGYDGVLADTRRTADAWLEGLAVPGCVPAGGRPLLSRLAGQFRPAGSRRSHASSQTVSPG
jgi:sugar phosphate isomerase/epimerase